MSFSRGKINPTHAARAVPPGAINEHLRSFIEKTEKTISNIQQRIGFQSVDFDRRTPVASRPSYAKAAVSSPIAGIFSIVIENPEYVKAQDPRARVSNPVRTPILHRLAFSLNSGFGADGDIRYYGPSTQTHWAIVDIPSSTRYMRVESSFDGENWNKEQILGPFQN